MKEEYLILYRPKNINYANLIVYNFNGGAGVVIRSDFDDDFDESLLLMSLLLLLLLFIYNEELLAVDCSWLTGGLGSGIICLSKHASHTRTLSVVDHQLIILRFKLHLSQNPLPQPRLKKWK